MIFNCEDAAALAETRDATFDTALTLPGPGLWAAVVSSGGCISGPAAASPGTLLLCRGTLELCAAGGSCHILAARLSGATAESFAAHLPAGAFAAKGDTCPGAAALLNQLRALDNDPAASARTKSQMVFVLLCELAGADAAEPALPPLVAEALASIQENYAGLYGVEELSERLGVSKSHLVRQFSAAMGVSPGKYLTAVRLDAAKRLLMHREYNLEIIASLCGFSGANYLCRVFKKETGYSPAAWRTLAMQTGSGLSADENLRAQAMYV